MVAAQPVERVLPPLQSGPGVSIVQRRPADAAYVRSAGASITPFVAITTWAVAWVGGQLLATALLAVAGHAQPSKAPLLLVLASTIGVWGCLGSAMLYTSHRFGSGQFTADYALRVRGIDAAGVGIGVLCQLVLIPIVYLPLEAIWPATFGDDRVQQNAADLADRASGATTVLLVLVVVVGAPIVEELVYRGLIQGSLASRVSTPIAVAATAALFTLIHFRPVEYPGLAVFAIVLGVAAAATKRLGLPIAIHIGFNATGLLMVMR